MLLYSDALLTLEEQCTNNIQKHLVSVTIEFVVMKVISLVFNLYVSLVRLFFVLFKL